MTFPRIARPNAPARSGVSLLLTLAATAAAGPFGFRGDGTGHYPDATPPAAWDAERIVWHAPIADWSNASPVVLGDRVLVCAEPAGVLCYALADGTLLWSAEQDYADVADTPEEARLAREARERLATLDPALRSAEQAVRRAARTAREAPDDAEAQAALATAERERDAARERLAPYADYRLPDRHDTTGLTSPTPVTDGRRFYVLLGSGTLAAYEPDGTRRWGRTVGRPHHGWGHSASPVLAGDRLILHIGNRLLAVDPDRGTTLWEAAGSSGWGTPAAVEQAGRWIVITPAGDWFDAADGTRIASNVQEFQWNGPVVVDGVVHHLDERGASAVAIDPDATPRPLWQADVQRNRYYATSLVHDGLVYNLHRAGRLTVLDAADGTKVYEQNIDFGRERMTVYPSPVAAAGRVYLSADNGVTVAIQAGRTFEPLGRGQLDSFRSTPVFVGRRVLIRTLRGLVCLE